MCKQEVMSKREALALEFLKLEMARARVLKLTKQWVSQAFNRADMFLAYGEHGNLDAFFKECTTISEDDKLFIDSH